MEQPIIHPSSYEEWKRYYQRKSIQADNQLIYICDKLPHILRRAMAGDGRDVHMLMRQILRRLEYPRDRDPLGKEIMKYPELMSPLREKQ